MPTKNRLVASLLLLVSTLALSGCDWVVMNPSGYIAEQEAFLINPLHAADADRHRAGDRPDHPVRLEIPGIEQQSRIRP